MANQVEKILRVGLIQKGRIIEERLLRKRESVTVGWSPRNTFVIPVQALPSSFLLFELQRTGYLLNFKEGTKGRLSLDQGVVELADLVKQGKARRKGDFFQIVLGDKARGKVQLGEVTLLFQFVTPPPLPPRLKLPATARGGLFSSVDWGLFSFTLVSALLIIVPTVYIRFFVHFPEVVRWKEPPREVTQILTKDDFPQKDIDKGKEEAKEEVKEEVKEEKKEEKKETVASSAKPDPEAAARAEAERKRVLAQKVRGKTLIKFLTTNADSEGGGRSMVDALAQGSSRTRLDDAFAGATGVASASAEMERSRRGGAGADDTGSVATIKDLAASGAQKTVASAGERTERKVTANIQVSGPEKTFGTGRMAPDEIARVVRSRISGVKSCYERELKKDPALAGKVVVQFTIGEIGRVTDCKVASATMNNPNVGRCICGRMGSWRFPPPTGGTVTVSYPFVFTASGG